MPYLTPENDPTGLTCRVLLVPNDRDWLAIVSGALQELTYSWNFEQYGAVTVERVTQRFQEMNDRMAYREGVCRVTGEIIPFAGTVSPDPAWLLCDGASLLRADYPALFAVIGTVYGAADGTHFNLPDLRGRVPLGAGDAPSLSAYAEGDTGGEETHTLVTSETPAHSHVDSGHTHSEIPAVASFGAALTGVPIPSAVPGLGITGSGFASISSVGSDGSHNNLQPYLAINYLIVSD